MKKSKFKIKVSAELLNLKIFFSTKFANLKNFFNDKFKKITKFPKFIKFKIIKYSTNYFKYSTNYIFDKFKKFKNIKFIKISNLSISIILFVTLLFLYLFYLSIPTLYNKETLQKDITAKLMQEFKINFSLSSNIRY